MRDALTTAAEAAGAGCIALGSFVLFGPGWALIVAGVLAISAGYLASFGGSE